MSFVYSNHASVPRKYKMSPKKEPMETITEGIQLAFPRVHSNVDGLSTLFGNFSNDLDQGVKPAVPPPQAASFERSTEILGPRNENATVRPKLERQDKSSFCCARRVRQNSNQKPVVVPPKPRRTATPVPISPKQYRLRRQCEGGLLFTLLGRFEARKVIPNKNRIYVYV
jgi:hypothetical protein